LEIGSRSLSGLVWDVSLAGAKIALEERPGPELSDLLSAAVLEARPAAVRLRSEAAAEPARVSWYGLSRAGGVVLGVEFSKPRVTPLPKGLPADPRAIGHVRHRPSGDGALALALGEVFHQISEHEASLETLLALVCEKARALVGAEGASFWRLEGERITEVAQSGPRWAEKGTTFTLEEAELLGSFDRLETRRRRGEQLFTNQLATSAWSEHRWVKSLGMQSAMIIPVSGRETRFGLLVFGHRGDPFAFNEWKQRQAELFARQAALFIEKEQMIRRVQEWSDTLESLNRIGLALHQRLDVDKVLEDICQESRGLFQVDLAIVFIRTGDGFVQRARAGAVPIPKHIGRNEFSLPEAEVTARGEGFFINHLERHPVAKQKPFYRTVDPATPTSLMVLPIREGDRVLGLLALVDLKNGERFTSLDLDKGKLLAEQAAQALANAHLHERVLESRRIIRQQDRFRILGELAGVVSHEIKNALVPLRTLVDLLPERYDDPSFRDWFTVTVREELERMYRLVTQLNRFDRMEEREEVATSPEELLKSVFELVKPEAASRGVRFEIESAPAPSIAVVANELRQVFLNLILNAIEAVDESGGSVRVGVGPDESGRGAVFWVSDNGPGIPPDNLETVFHPLYTTREHGTGLGLAVARDLVRAHDGTIQITSTMGKGTTFTVTIPASHGSSTENDESGGSASAL
jgi:signal transduction histidine kinase